MAPSLRKDETDGRLSRAGFLFLSLLLSLVSQTTPGMAISEQGYAEVFEDAVLTYYRENGVSGSFLGSENVRIAWMKVEVENETGALVILEGRAECYAKYAEVIYDLRDLGFSVYLMDHSGQGFSGRELSDPDKGYIEHFGDYVTDLKTFMDTVVNARPHARRFLLSHSMGGCIGTLYAEQRQRDFDGIVLCAPMFQIRTSPYPEFIADAMVSILDVFGQGDAYAPGEHAFDPDWSFEENDITHSRVRFEMRRRVIADNPGVALGGPTNRWVRETIRATRKARAGASRLTVPVLLLQAGDDLLVTPWGQEQFMRKAPACRRIAFPEASHELLMETDSIRDAVLREIRSFLIETAPRREP